MYVFAETMTSKERTVAALTGKPYDRIPVNLLISDHAARVIGVTVQLRPAHCPGADRRLAPLRGG